MLHCTVMFHYERGNAIKIREKYKLWVFVHRPDDLPNCQLPSPPPSPSLSQVRSSQANQQLVIAALCWRLWRTTPTKDLLLCFRTNICQPSTHSDLQKRRTSLEEEAGHFNLCVPAASTTIEVFVCISWCWMTGPEERKCWWKKMLQILMRKREGVWGLSILPASLM